MLRTLANSPVAVPFLPQDLTNLPFLSNFAMPYWNVDHPSLPARDGDAILAAEAEQHLDMNRIEYLANAGLTTRVEWTGYGQRMENFPDRDLCQKVFSTPQTAPLGDTFVDTDLVCPIRGGEIFDGRHGGYTLLPVAFWPMNCV